ncbi:MAG: amidohydrolase family protein, partial [Methylovirgula sp.]|nr:amidohydrolase family protein [Methylovirgula sp.]
MLIRLAGGRVVDPVTGRDGTGDIWIRDSRIIEAPSGETPDEVFDVSGKIVMAGAIDIHSHIAGGNVNTARLLLPENHRSHTPRPAQNAVGVLQTSGWMTGFPIRTGFGRGYPEHDTWRFDANRLVDAGEADAALWISAYGAS